MDILSSPKHLQSFFTTTTTTQQQHNIIKYPQQNLARSSVVVRVNAAISHKHLQIPISDTFAWNNLIQIHLTNDDPDSVLRIYLQMLHLGASPDRYTLPRVLSAPSTDLNFGTQLHCHALKLGFSSDKYVITSLINLYGNLGCLDSAKLVFDKCSFGEGKNLVTWTVLARLYLGQNKPEFVIALFDELDDGNMDAVALSTVVRATGMLKSLSEGKRVHDFARECGFEYDVLVSNSLKMYVDCGSVEDAKKMFDRMPSKDVISWTELIRAYVKQGRP